LARTTARIPSSPSSDDDDSDDVEDDAIVQRQAFKMIVGAAKSYF
jgi:hypothetical protein